MSVITPNELPTVAMAVVWLLRLYATRYASTGEKSSWEEFSPDTIYDSNVWKVFTTHDSSETEDGDKYLEAYTGRLSDIA